MATLEIGRTLGTGEAFLRRHHRSRRRRDRLRLSVHFGSVAGEDIGAAEELITEGAWVLFRLVGGQVPPKATAVLKGFFAVRAVVPLRVRISHERTVDDIVSRGCAAGRLLRLFARILRQRQVGRQHLLHVLQLILLAPEQDALSEAAEVLVVAVEVDEHRGHEVMRHRRGRRARRRRRRRRRRR